MTVRYRQSVDGEVTDERAVEPVDPADTDAMLLCRKAESAAEKGWTVEWSSAVSFTATKDRWGGALCVREFWAD